MDELIATLNVAIARCKYAFVVMEFEYNNVLQYGIVGHDLALGIAMEDLKHAHWNFELVCNCAMHSINLMFAIERCKDAFAAMEAEYKNVFQPGIVGHDLALDIAKEELKYAHWHLEWVSNNARHVINMRIAGQQVALNATAAELVPVGPIVADVSEKHNTVL